MLLEMRDVEVLREYVLRLEFSNGVTREMDLRDELHGEIFEPRRNFDVFSQVALNGETRTVE